MSEAEPKTKIISVHPLRSVARRNERRLQKALDEARDEPTSWPEKNLIDKAGIPDWANGVRVRQAGRFQHVVEATERRGS